MLTPAVPIPKVLGAVSLGPPLSVLAPVAAASTHLSAAAARSFFVLVALIISGCPSHTVQSSHTLAPEQGWKGTGPWSPSGAGAEALQPAVGARRKGKQHR